ncbi:class I SAM-dependent methyltransferase [Daejeonella sp.]|uniref:class I SAM-dependent methyltransferase n=1 Tax=Daejeonella sp. TaxID=2805397 RepID=UPI0030BC5B5F
MYSSEYGLMYHSEEKLWWYIGLRGVLGYYMERYSAPNHRILDVGCGTGKNMEFLISRGYENIEGLDYSADAIEFCRKRNLRQVHQGSVTDINFPDNSFDVVYCMDVLGCLDEQDRTAAAAELFRVLKPGGVFMANSASLNIFRSQHDDVGNIKIRFSKNEFINLFKLHHYELKKLSYRVFFLSPLVLLFKSGKNLLRFLQPGKKSQSDQVIFPFGINWCLTQVQLLENRFLRYLSLPFGSSVFIVLIKSGSSPIKS